MKFDVSVVIATYNPIWEKLKKTVNSILFQKNISYELIICDDGSKENYFDRLEKMLDGKCHYKLIPSFSNVGTCKNVYNGLKKSLGRYVKLISPGDYLYDEFCLNNWIDYMKKNNFSVSFGNAVYYNTENDNMNIVCIKNNPQNPYMYKKNSLIFSQKEDYLVTENLILGAAILLERDLFCDYLIKIIGKVVYAEDNIFRLMIFNNIKIIYYPNKVLWYEYGSGISTNGNSIWNEKIKNDYNEATKIMIEMPSNNIFSKRYKLLMKKHLEKKNIKYLKYILFPRTALWRIIRQIKPTMTVSDFDRAFFDKL